MTYERHLETAQIRNQPPCTTCAKTPEAVCFNVGDNKYCAYCIRIGGRCELSKSNKARRGADISTILSTGIRLCLDESPRQADLIRYVRHTCRLFRRSYPSDFAQSVQAQADAHDITEEQLLAGLFPGDLPDNVRPGTAQNAFVASFVPAGFVPGRLAITGGAGSSSPASAPSGGSRKKAPRPVADFTDDSDVEVTTPAPSRGTKRKAPAPFPLRKRTAPTVEDVDDEPAPLPLRKRTLPTSVDEDDELDETLESVI